jgi:hypothetical protein
VAEPAEQLGYGLFQAGPDVTFFSTMSLLTVGTFLLPIQDSGGMKLIYLFHQVPRLRKFGEVPPFFLHLSGMVLKYAKGQLYPNYVTDWNGHSSLTLSSNRKISVLTLKSHFLNIK